MSQPEPTDVFVEYRGLRSRVIDELSLVAGHIALSEHLDGDDAKQQLRLAHEGQRRAVMKDAAQFVLAREPDLIEHFADGDEVTPSEIDPVLIPVRTPDDADLFRYATLGWSVPVSAGYGRRSRFLVRDRSNGKLIGIFALGDPVIAQKARDTVIGWSTEQRGQRLYNVYDAYILGAVEPYRQLLAGKLMALMTLTNEARGFLSRKYTGTVTEIRGEQKDPTPVLITTSSALGRSSVYNRVTYRGTTMFQSVGFTKGYGHFQFSEELFREMRKFVATVASDDELFAGRVQSSRYGSGPNWRFRVIRNALDLLNIPQDSLRHNIRREVFLAPVASNWDAFLRGETDEAHPLDIPADDVGDYYRERWAVGRGARRPAFKEWRRHDHLLAESTDISPNSATSELDLARPGNVSMGAYTISTGTQCIHTRGEPMAGAITDGVAYLSALRAEGMHLTMADISWANGDREIRGWSRHDSDELFEQVVGRLRIGIYKSALYQNMALMEIRLPRSVEGRKPTARQTNLAELDSLLGFDLASALDALGEATVGTRGELARETGRRKNELCVIFPSDNRSLPAVVWALTRPIALGLRSQVKTPLPAFPEQESRAPELEPSE